MSGDDLAGNVHKLEALAHKFGLDFYPVDFEMTPASFMLEISVYGLPVRMPHWSFGVLHPPAHPPAHGHSRIFEVMFPAPVSCLPGGLQHSPGEHAGGGARAGA
jgi:stage V sporulation protein R